jgi:transmembrane sensor
MQDSIRIEEIAAEWLARRDRGDWSESDQAELTAWLNASTANRVAYIRLETAWGKTRYLKGLAGGGSPGKGPVPRRKCRRVSVTGRQRLLVAPDGSISGSEPTEQ